MKNKFFAMMAMTALTALLALAVSAQSNKKNDPSRAPQQKPPVMQLNKVTLSCSPGQGKDVSTPMYVKNPTGQDVPSGTTINWSAKVAGGGTATGKETTTQVLQKNNGNQISLLGPAGNLASCQASYTKK